MAMWDYKVVQVLGLGGARSAGNLEKVLNKLGDEGWEFVASITPAKDEEKPYLIFKRPLVRK